LLHFSHSPKNIPIPFPFIFGDYQLARTMQGASVIATVPNAAFRAGDFSARFPVPTSSMTRQPVAAIRQRAGRSIAETA
jgi:hypothetical protein